MEPGRFWAVVATLLRNVGGWANLAGDGSYPAS
jgi:hypothetical protein